MFPQESQHLDDPVNAEFRVFGSEEVPSFGANYKLVIARGSFETKRYCRRMARRIVRNGKRLTVEPNCSCVRDSADI
jgi:hypothetical protein